MWNHGSASWAVTWQTIFDVENPWCSSLSRRNNVARLLCVAGSLSPDYVPMLMRPDLLTRFDLSVGSVVEPRLNRHREFLEVRPFKSIKHKCVVVRMSCDYLLNLSLFAAVPVVKLCAVLSFNTARLRIICAEDCAHINVACEDVTCASLCDAKWLHQTVPFSFLRFHICGWLWGRLWEWTMSAFATIGIS